MWLGILEIDKDGPYLFTAYHEYLVLRQNCRSIASVALKERARAELRVLTNKCLH